MHFQAEVFKNEASSFLVIESVDSISRDGPDCPYM